MPREFGRLLLLKLIARGGMGDVCLAATTGIEGAERACIVKTVRRDHIHDGSFLARFLDEARVQSQLNHPGVAQVLEASTDENGEPYTVVEYVEGRSLADVRQRAIQLGARVSWIEAVAVTIEIAQALAHVHERSGSDGLPLGIVHRDLSPQNVMIGYAGEVKLIDFGTARGHNRRCHTVAGVVFAKPGYVAPEVARQQIGDGRIDVYALGVMLWEMCKGTRFFTGDAQKHLEDAAAARFTIPAIAKSIDAPLLLDEIIAKLTANDPDARYESAGKAVLDLARLIGMAPTCKGERGVRARVAMLMRTLWPHEPGRSRAEFAKLLKEARKVVKESPTPSASRVMDGVASRMAPSDPSVLAGTSYRLLRVIGEGSSGVVYEAEHIELGRKVAIKLLSPEHASATDAIDRFRREARAIAKLSHPNLALLYDFGKSLDGRVFLAMELLGGETLDKRLKQGAFEWREAMRLGVEVARALEAAHGAAVVHRDLKPANLFLTEGGGVKLLDFGVAMALAETTSDASGTTTQDGAASPRAEGRQRGFAIFGTPEYMAPEQVAGEPVDGRCDLYALGCVLYELVTGVRVFSGTSSVVVMGKQLRELAEGPRARMPARNIPLDVEAVIMRALAKRPADRFVNATAMREALEATLASPGLRRSRVRRVAASLVMGSMMLAVAGGTARWAASRSNPASFVAPAEPVGTLVAFGQETGPTTLPSNAAPPAAAEAPVSAANAQGAPSDGAASTPESNLADAPAERAQHLEAAPPASRADKDRALAEARAHAKTKMSDPSALKTWAWAAFRAGDLREARRAGQAWALHDGTAEPKMFMVGVLDGGGHHAQAKAVLEEWLQLHPDDEDARALLAHVGSERGKSELARK